MRVRRRRLDDHHRSCQHHQDRGRRPWRWWRRRRIRRAQVPHRLQRRFGCPSSGNTLAFEFHSSDGHSRKQRATEGAHPRGYRWRIQRDLRRFQSHLIQRDRCRRWWWRRWVRNAVHRWRSWWSGRTRRLGRRWRRPWSWWRWKWVWWARRSRPSFTHGHVWFQRIRVERRWRRRCGRYHARR